MDVAARVDACDIAFEVVQEVHVAVPVEEVQDEEGRWEELSRAGVDAVEDNVGSPIDFHFADRLAPALEKNP